MTLRELATRVAWTHMGEPYRWGGDDPIAGFDCSGLVIEILRSVGILPLTGDWTADRLRRIWERRLVKEPHEGCLALWLDPSGFARHVEYCIDAEHTIGASGGGSATTSREAAVKANAYVKVRPWKPRGGRVMFVDPFQEEP